MIRDVAAVLRPSDLRCLRAACVAGTVVHVVEPRRLETVIRLRGIAVVVVDPAMVTESELIRYLAGQVPVVAFADTTPLATRTLRQLGLQHVVFRGESPEGCRAVLNDSLLGGSVDLPLARLAAALAPLPQRLCTAIDAAFRMPHDLRGARDLARLARVPQRTVSRWCQAGLASPLGLVIARRVFHACTGMRTGDQVADVARRPRCGPDEKIRDAIGCEHA